MACRAAGAFFEWRPVDRWRGAFIGDLDRRFQAFDTETGESLWSTRLPAPAHGYPITYEASGKQFVAIPTGIGVFRALTAVIFPDIYQPPDGQGLFVFSLNQ